MAMEHPDYHPANADEEVQVVRRVLAGQIRDCEALTSPQLVRGFLRVKLGALEYEVFTIIHLDAQSRVIGYAGMFHTLPHAPRLCHARFRQ